MPGSAENRTITGWRPASRFYRKPPGLGWLVAVLVIPLLLGVLGWITLDPSHTEIVVSQPTTLPPFAAAPTVNAPAPADACATLQSEVTALLTTPISFDANGFTPASSSQPLLTQVADKLKACPDTRVAVNGYTDNSGNDGINIPLSGSRAKAVADFLVSQGVAADRVTSEGFGSANPIAGNDTPEGKAMNRRVEIIVS